MASPIQHPALKPGDRHPVPRVYEVMWAVVAGVVGAAVAALGVLMTPGGALVALLCFVAMGAVSAPLFATCLGESGRYHNVTRTLGIGAGSTLVLVGIGQVGPWAIGAAALLALSSPVLVARRPGRSADWSSRQSRGVSQ